MFMLTRLAAIRAVVATGAVAAVGLAGLAGCSAPPNDGAMTVTAKTIVVANYPLEFLAARLAPSAEIVNLTQPGTEPHDLELNAAQLEAIATADLVVYQPGFQPAVDAAIDAAGARAVVDVTAGVTMRDVDQTSQPDPHIWLDPANMAQMAQTIAAAVDGTDETLTALTAELTALDGRFSAGLASCEHRQFITTHAAFGYLAARYQLEQIPIDGIDPTAEPSAARIAAVQALARQHSLTTVFTEPLAPGEVAESLAADLGLATDVLDPVEGVTATSRGGDYLSIMDANLAALRKAGGCS